MATLVLSTVGTALGGPLGGAIGGLIGHTIDQQLLGPGPRRGPRLGDLSVQSSSYGTPIPRIYGTLRVAGSVIWSTDLQENSQPQSGSKGQPAVVVYSYSVSFAVALSCRRVHRIKRIWADGKLLRGAAGDFKVRTRFRFYPGTEDQEVDPLIASVEGIGKAPAYRGTALAVFEDLELAEFGNRIPFLTFEVEAEAAPVSVDLVLRDASGGLIDASAPQQLEGYAAYGRTTSDALQPLIEHLGIDLVDSGTALASPSPLAKAINDIELGCSADDDRFPSIERSRAPSRALPAALTITYYDQSRDYQAGQVRATSGGAGGVHEAVELPIAMGAGAAKALAESSVAKRWSRRESLVLRLPPSRMDLEPGTVVQVEGEPGLWQAEKATIERLSVIVQLRRVSNLSERLPADAGRAMIAPDIVAGPTTLALLDLPDLGMVRHDVPVLHVAACGSPGAWRPVPLQIEIGSELRVGQAAPGEAILGVSRSVLAMGQSALLDLDSSVQVELADAEHWLESRTDEALAEGANLALIGSELIQFGSAVPTESGGFLLRRLLRGRRGTEWAMGSHVADERFVLLAPEALQALELPHASLETQVRVTALGRGDGAGTAVSAPARGEAMRPPSPVHLNATRRADGSLHIAWVRRSRSGWAWMDQVDVPIGESQERYRIRIERGSGFTEIETSLAHASFSTEQLQALGSDLATITVTQVGDYAQSRPATLIVALN